MNNITLFQFFHWYTTVEDNLWIKACAEASYLEELGITHVWLPPAYKSALGQNEPGYAVYDLYDLGEFDQKGTVRTKYGTKNEYLQCIREFHAKNINVLADIVLNHKHGADEKETVRAHKIHPENRMEVITEEETIEAHTKFLFPGRQGKYSDYVWDSQSFTGISENNEDIYLLLHQHSNSQWEEMLEGEKGNYDYLMGADIEFRNPHVRDELKKWAKWYIETTGIDGFRLDALKHINYKFYNEWLDYLKQEFGKDFLCIGEYWRNDVGILMKYQEVTEQKIQLFDVPLHYNFHAASISDSSYDMRSLFESTLVQQNPTAAITFVDNHDTQPLQSLQSPVDEWFKPLAYSIILLREQGIPCVFYPSLYGSAYIDRNNDSEVSVELTRVASIERLLKVRKILSYGTQRDYLDHANTIGWTREGITENENSGVAVVVTNGTAGDKDMEIGKQHSRKIFIDITGNHQGKVEINDDGIGKFFVNDRSVSVWIREDAIQLIDQHE